MGKIKKKGTSGAAKNYISRTQAVRKLQISLPDFRRLCIFKGVYPREPRSRKRVSKSATASTTFYYTRDIQYLLHEPVLQKFRDHKAFAKKIAKALGRGDVSNARRLERTIKPTITLDHVIKERYPTFVDALRDLDDALCMLFLFANLPSTSAVPPEKIRQCERLCLEFEHYVITSHSLRKSFLSIKGIYYQATVQGQDIMWLVPYQFAQKITGDVDFRIMGTFVEFYSTLLSFVNFKLFTDIGLVYPPKLNRKSDEDGGGLRAFTLEGKTLGIEQESAQAAISDSMAQEQLASLPLKLATLSTAAQTDVEAQLAREQTPGEEDVANDSLDTFQAPIAADGDVLLQPTFNDGAGGSTVLFAPFTIYLSRETPRQPLEFLLRAFGCKRIGWAAVLGDGAVTTDELDSSITHQIVDRPPVAGIVPEAVDEIVVAKPGMRVPGRIYIQPQWVWDCVNAGALMPADEYGPGTVLPPHLSPWVQATSGGYDPSQPLENEEEFSESELVDGDEEDGGIRVGLDQDLNKASFAGEGMLVDEDEDEDEESDEQEPDVEESESESSARSRSPSPASIHQHELEAEALGVAPPTVAPTTSAASKARKSAAAVAKKEADELERQKMMMSRKKRKLLEKMLYGKRKAEDEAKELRKKRRILEKA